MDEKIKENVMKGKYFNELVELAKKLGETGESLEITEEELKSISKETTLKAMRISNDKTNFDIMCMLPLDKETIRKTLGLGDAEYFRHIKQLMRYDMVENNSETQTVEITNFGESCIHMTNHIIEDVYIHVKLALKCASETVQEK